MSEPSFSILVPTYNQAQYLGTCLDSIAMQTDPDWEAIVINDGSTDGTAELADSYARRDTRFRVVHKENGGVASALNEGLRQARGSWIHWLSSDDLFDPRKLEINRDAIREFPDCKFFFSYFRLLRQSTLELSDHGLWGPLPDRKLQIPTLFFQNYISGITICVERAAWQSIGFFNESLRYAQDYEMWLRLLTHFPARFIDQWTVTNRNHALQGSEVFPQACYYDTAMAAILFLNRQSFESLFPLMDLTDPIQAVRALDYSLTVTGDPSAFLYALGCHPALLWRAMEWIVVTEQRDPALGRRLRTKARWICREHVRRPCKHGASFIWNVMGAALAIKGLSTSYQQLDPVAIAVDHYFELRSAADPAAEQVAEYLRQFHGLSLSNARPANDAGGDLALILDVASGEVDVLVEARSLVREFAVRGWRTVIFMEGPPAYRQDGTTPVITGPKWKIVRLASKFRNRCVLSSNISNAQFPHNYLVLPLSTIANAAILAKVIASLSSPVWMSPDNVAGEVGKAIPLVFLTRALHGGGAERVLYDIVHALDGDRFSIGIIPLFNSAFSPVFRNGNVAASFEAERSASVKLNAAHRDAPTTPSAPRAGFPKWVVAVLSGLSLDQRRRIKASLPFRTAAFVLRAIKSAYRTTRDRGQQARARSRAPMRGNETAIPLELVTQESLLAYTNMAAYVTEILRALGPRAIMISLMEEATIVAWLASLRTPVRHLAWLHTVESLYLDQIFPNPTDRQEFDLLLQTAVARSEKCIFPSRGCCDDLASLYDLPADHFQVIYNPIDLAAVKELGSLPPEKTFPDAGFPIIVSLGRLAPEKNHEHLLKALTLVQRRRKDFLCLIIGDGDLIHDIAARIEYYKLGDNVRLLGSVRNPFPYLFRAKALVLTSKFESFAVVLIEALASGAIPVAVDCPTGPREVLDDGRVGILVPPHDERALADAIETVLWHGQDSLEVLTSMANRVKSFDIGAVSLQWEQLIEKTFSKSAGADIERCDHDSALGHEKSRVVVSRASNGLI